MPNLVLPGLRKVARAVMRGSDGDEARAAEKREFLRVIDIFQDLLATDLCQVEAHTRMTTVRKGEIIYRQEDATGELFLLKYGAVRLFRLSANGKKLDLGVLEPGTFFGEMPLLGQRMRNASAEAMSECVLCMMSRADVEWLLLSKPQVALRVLEILSERLAASEARLVDLAYRGVPARLASALLRLGQGRGLIEGTTHQELGDLVGAYRETVTKILDEFQAAGFVEVARRRIRILDPDGLARLLSE